MPTVVRRAKAKAKARVERAAQVKRSNERRDARFAAVKKLNTLAEEISLPGNRVPAREARDEDVERLVRLLEVRLAAPAALESLRAAAQMWTENGGRFSTPVLEQDFSTPSPLGRHRVLLPTFKLKSKAFMLTYNGANITATSFDTFRTFVLDLKTRFGARAWAACLEESLHAQDAGRHHLHAYLMWTDGVGLDVRSLDPFYFEGLRPRVDVCTAKLATTSPHTAACHGLWYVSVMKAGTLHADTNFPAGQWYKPKARWLEGLLDEGKIELDKYIQMSATKFPVGHSTRKRDAEEAFRDVRTSNVHDHVLKELQGLQDAGAYLEPRTYQVVDDFVAEFAGRPKWRRPVLLIVGGTNLGKSMLGGAVLKKVAGILGLQKKEFLEVTVEGDGHLDLADFDLTVHAGVLLDGVADALMLKKVRESLQGRPKAQKGARSATMRHAYAYTFARRAIVATMDLSADNLHMLYTDHWLSDPRNVKVLRLTAPSWQDGDEAAAAPQQALGRLDEMKTWSAKTVTGFLEQADLVGPAKLLFQSGVNGADLIEFRIQELVDDLRLSAFAARKVLKARDDFLSSA